MKEYTFIAVIIVALCVCGVLFGTVAKHLYGVNEKIAAFASNCALEKGVAVYDIERRLRCVPSFSEVRHDR